MTDQIPPEGTGLPNPTAPAQGVKPTASEQPDYLTMLKEKDEKIAKLQGDVGNYRKGMLKYKKESEANPDDKSFEDERIRQIVQEQIASSELARESSEKDSIIQKMARENSELRTTVINKSQVLSMPGGSSQPQDDVKPQSLTEEQKAELTKAALAIGAKPEDFIKRAVENLKKVK